MSLAKRILAIDPRIIFIIIFLAVAIPLFIPLGLPVTITKEVKDIYEYIEKLKEGDYVIAALDYDPSTIAEMQPMAHTTLRHCFRKNLKVIGTGLFQHGTVLAEADIKFIANEFGKKYGEDYCFLGYKPFPAVVIMAMGENFRLAFPEDYYGKKLDDIPMMKGITNYNDIKLVINISATSGVDYWILYGHERYKVPLAIGMSGVMASNYYQFLQSGQVIGMLPGLKGASEYEKLLGERGPATSYMDVQSIVHIVIIIFIILGNISYFIQRRQKAAPAKGA